MSEIRKDFITETYIIFAPDRANRPSDFHKNHTIKSEVVCPFCFNTKNPLPAEAMLYYNSTKVQNRDQWEVAVIPNKFPVVDIHNKQKYSSNHWMYKSSEGYGIHEVIIDHPEHDCSLAQFPIPHIKSLLVALQDRYREAKKNEQVKYIQIFKNQGGDGGASLSHSHWQIVGLPFIPQYQKIMYKNAEDYFYKHHQCVFCKMIEIEQDEIKRVIDENKDFLTFCPYGSRFSYESWIIPKKHIYSITDLTVNQLSNLAMSIKQLFSIYNAMFSGFSFNICCMEGKSNGLDSKQNYHWHIQIIPRFSSFAGLELGTGTFINPILPETAVKKMKEALDIC